ncbi:hypothetical protein F5148DRAFT_1374166 [Russula earlei]|uniref:Uncharacterized protein n=1 Tax=Russula earlei TaxID=71964 RepID=A0ACC0UIE8_9AGAM|nr:hypothetical protein F5148DRAFT_1374166 [Russula earlei]
MLLPQFPLPLPPNQPPSGYGWEERDFSALSSTTAFITGIDGRDKFLGRNRCVICGVSASVVLEYAHIIGQADPETWTELRDRSWIPLETKDHPQHEPRDGLLMCVLHHRFFDAYTFFIRFFPDVQKFIFINYPDEPILRMYHGKAIALDITDRYAPFPSLFIIHEMRVRGFHPFAPPIPPMPTNLVWQDWILSDGVFDNVSGSFKRNAPSRNRNTTITAQPQPLSPLATTIAGGASSGGRTLALNADVIADILAATRAMPSWKACQVEGTSWTGTAQENIQKYVSTIGV